MCLILEQTVSHPLGRDGGNKKEANDGSEHNGTGGLTDPSPLPGRPICKKILTSV